jgi:hypothetical protein
VFIVHPSSSTRGLFEGSATSAGLLARGSSCPACLPRHEAQWRIAGHSPLTVAGAAAVWGLVARTAFPILPRQGEPTPQVYPKSSKHKTVSRGLLGSRPFERGVHRPADIAAREMEILPVRHVATLDLRLGRSLEHGSMLQKKLQAGVSRGLSREDAKRLTMDEAGATAPHRPERQRIKIRPPGQIVGRHRDANRIVAGGKDPIISAPSLASTDTRP